MAFERVHAASASTLLADVERGYLVSWRDVCLGHYPYVEKVVLVSSAEAEQCVCPRLLELVDAPPSPLAAPPCSDAWPLLVVSLEDAALDESVRPAVIVRDARESR